jgi:hypothetical protein
VSRETKDPARKALAALFAAITNPDAFEVEDGKLVENPHITSALFAAKEVLRDEDCEGFPIVTLTMPLRDARATRDSLRNTLCFLRGMRVGAGPDAEDGPEADMLVDMRALAHRLDEVVEPALADFEGSREMPF